jgi:hypothetical protein
MLLHQRILRYPDLTVLSPSSQPYSVIYSLLLILDSCGVLSLQIIDLYVVFAVATALIQVRNGKHLFL